MNIATKYIKPVEIYDVDILRGRYRNFSGADKGYGRLDPVRSTSVSRTRPRSE